MKTENSYRIVPLTCLLVLLSCGLVRGQGQEPVPSRTPTDVYPFVTNMDDVGDYILRWNFDDVEIRFQIQVRTLGYVAFGISESGFMVPADVVVGYVANGNATLRDFHTTAYTQPVEDASQDWELEYGREVNGWTVFAFKRRLDTCDVSDDRPITKDTLQLIYAYDAVDPTDLNSLFHHDKRGSKPVSLLTRPRPPRQVPNDLQTVDFRNSNYTIPSNRTTSYYCMVFNLSHVTQKYHAIKVAPIINEATKLNVHRMMLYRCKITDPDVSVRTGEGSDCFTDAPDHIQFCREYVAGFGQGEDEFYLPEDVGLPIGGVDEPDIYVLNIHYDNSNYESGLVDNSGIQVTVTSQLRPQEGAFLTMGNIVSKNWTQFIPPGESDYVQKAYCSQRCLAWLIIPDARAPVPVTRSITGTGNQAKNTGSSLLSPLSPPDVSIGSRPATFWESGTIKPAGLPRAPQGFLGSGSATPMTIAGVQFHAHEAGKTMKLRHLTYSGTDQVNENAWVDNDKSFDSHAGSFRVVKDRAEVGFYDQLLLECSYDTMSKTWATAGGWTINHELCRAYVFYYPRKRLEGCMSWSAYDQLVDVSGRRINGPNVFPTLWRTDWLNDRGMRQNLKEALDSSIESGQCWSSMQPTKNAIDFFYQPRVTTPYLEPPRSSCRLPTDVRMADVQMFGK